MGQMPFVFGHLTDGTEFTNRRQEIDRLLSDFRAGINVTLISPRRWGKSSLVRAVARKAARADKKMKFCFIDLFSIRSEAQFYQVLAEEVIKSTSSKFKEWVAAAKRFIPEAIPRVSFETPVGEFDIGMNWKAVVKSPGQILDLAEKICEDKGIRLVVCIDEFQNISTFEDPLGFQKQLRASWQHHKLTAYCIYGSKRHMMMEVFASPSMPFYKFGDLVFLDKISTEDWCKFIVKRFADTGKRITDEDAVLIAELVDRHSYYVQQLAQQVWLRTAKQCTTAIVHDTHDSLMRQMSLLFQEKTNQLSNSQINFLEAVLDGVQQYSAQEVLRQYELGSSSNVQVVKKALISKEVLDFRGRQAEFLDPLYAAWLKKYYFGK
ncbi:MAG: ATP-binding protein [Saprospiraceae bacterium]|nr:ATP-binding protein [Saprospiraceae bacterium]